MQQLELDANSALRSNLEFDRIEKAHSRNAASLSISLLQRNSKAGIDTREATHGAETEKMIEASREK